MRKVKVVMLAMVLVAIVMMAGCASETPWRRVSVSTFELVGDGLATAKDTAIILNQNKVLSDEKLARAKEIYNIAYKIYGQMGSTLILAGKAETVVKRDELLTKYDALLADFKKQSAEILKLIKEVK